MTVNNNCNERDNDWVGKNVFVKNKKTKIYGGRNRHFETLCKKCRFLELNFLRCTY